MLSEYNYAAKTSSSSGTLLSPKGFWTLWPDVENDAHSLRPKQVIKATPSSTEYILEGALRIWYTVSREQGVVAYGVKGRGDPAKRRMTKSTQLDVGTGVHLEPAQACGACEIQTNSLR